MSILVVSRIFTEVCSHHHCLMTERVPRPGRDLTCCCHPVPLVPQPRGPRGRGPSPDLPARHVSRVRDQAGCDLRVPSFPRRLLSRSTRRLCGPSLPPSRLGSVPLYGCATRFICSSVDGHMVVSTFLVIMNDAAVNIHAQAPVGSRVQLSRVCPEKGN